MESSLLELMVYQCLFQKHELRLLCECGIQIGAYCTLELPRANLSAAICGIELSWRDLS
ncbi:hypothetical protein M569_13053 [Genlisea aurea]|uniref:Uncharacterized protein n=1 Tax=Genlisea aurea TaxID=192259 RepID=S8CBJ1_9LAMI|nr:hypothetical protein M569_13053 [Genlisea aurea]